MALVDGYPAILLASLSIRVLGTGYALWLFVRVRDRRFLFLTALLSLMALSQGLVAVGTGAPSSEVPALLVSVLAIAIVAYIDRHRQADRALETDLRESNDRLRANRLRLEATLDASPEYIFVFDSDARYVEILSGEDRITLRDPAAFIGASVADIIPGPAAPRIQAVIERTLETDAGHRLEYHIPREGRVEWYEAQTAPINHADVPEKRVLFLARDITERKERERQVQVLDRVLRHNLKNAMNVILGNAERAASTGVEPATEAAAAITEASDTLLAVAEKERQITAVLLDRPHREAIDVGRHVDDAVETVGERFPAASIETTVDRGLVAMATRDLGRAVMELVDNAIRHADRDTPTVRVSATASGDSVVIVVADDGPGIPEEERTILTGAREIGPLYHGSGLGLWLVYWIVTRSAGGLTFEETDPRGSTVTLTLDAA